MKQNILFFLSILSVCNKVLGQCEFDSSQIGIQLGQYEMATRVEHALKLPNIDTQGLWRIRIFSLGSFLPAKMVDIGAYYGKTKFVVFDSIRDNKKSLMPKVRFKKIEFLLSVDETKKYENDILKLGVEHMYSIQPSSTDPDRMYLTKAIILNYFNIFIYASENNCIGTQQFKFIQYIGKIIKEKTGIEF